MNDNHQDNGRRETNTTTQRKIVDLEFLSSLRVKYPTAIIVHCHGVFDILHAGHLAYFEAAKRKGNLLVVTITADEFVNKGPGRPYFPTNVRAAMIAGLEVVDFVSISSLPTAVKVINSIQPHFYVKGPDYREKDKDITGGIWEEESAVERGGGRLVFSEEPTYSSSHLLNEYFSTWTPEQLAAIDKVRAAGGLSVFEDLLEEISRLEIVVVGEPIVDTYVFCRPEALSSKSPTVSARLVREVNYAGGSLAIANNLADFVKETTILISHGNEGYFRELLQQHMHRRVKIVEEVYEGIPTPRKTRFISDDNAQRMFELTDLRSDQWHHHDPSQFCTLLRTQFAKEKTLIVADFGHGLFEGKVIDVLSEFDGFIALNVQTNSSNYGFNPFSKHRHFSFLSIDTREARVAYHDRYSEPLHLVRRIWQEHCREKVAVAMTTGPHGAHYFSANGKSEVQSPAFASKVIDATGAGDAFFGITALLVKVGAPEVMIPFLGNVFAGLKAKIIGHQTSVTKAQFVKAVTGILK